MPCLLASGGDVADFLLTDGIRIAVIIVVALAADLLLHRLVPPAVRLAMEGRVRGRPSDETAKRLHTLAGVFTGSARAVIAIIALFTILPLAGINIAPLLASVGIVGLAIGFGAQGLVKDIVRGIYILVDNQFATGDIVQIAGISGQVQEVGLRRTVLRDLDGVVHYIPNGEITVASNYTQEYSRVNMDVTVAHQQDIDGVIEVINQIGQEMAADPQWAPLLLTPPSVLRVDNLSSAGVDLKIVGDTQPTKQWDVEGELRKRLMRAF
jgi:small conductance mechanosensitive channel